MRKKFRNEAHDKTGICSFIKEEKQWILPWSFDLAEAYNIAAIKFRGLNAVTNFEINRYDVKSILVSSTLPIGGAAKRLKDAENAEMALDIHRANEASLNLHLPDGSVTGYGNGLVA
ncbi:hypothetical protein ACS0TY_006946 [Phlomoides rotata]